MKTKKIISIAVIIITGLIAGTKNLMAQDSKQDSIRAENIRKQKGLILSQPYNEGVVLPQQNVPIYNGGTTDVHRFRDTYKNVNELLHCDSSKTVYLKAHMKNGGVYVFTGKWSINKEQTQLSGTAIHYDFNRNKLSNGLSVVPIDSVAIFETNSFIESQDAWKITVLSILTAVSVAIDIYCLTNPKACFGSCPTFYYQNDNNISYANAEGFSSSICPALEAGDIDALNNPPIHSNDFLLTMKNEALETHAVNAVKLLAVPRKENQRIFHDKHGDFYACENLTAPVNAFANGQDITNKIKMTDDEEWYSVTDSNDLHTKETINLTFNDVKSKNGVGLVVNFRQTLLTTFLLYTAYGYMGNEVGDIFAKIETDERARKKLSNPYQILGGIEVFVFNDKHQRWQIADTLYETGPITRNLQFVSLPEECKGQNNYKIQLRLTKGLWRIDYLALASIVNKETPLELLPDVVTRNGFVDANVLTNISSDDNKYQPSLPGDIYKLHFNLPDNKQDYELFVFSKGYYLEWIRRNWLAEKNLLKLKGMLENNKAIWNSLAKEFKEVEGTMEETFWNSKISGRF